MLIELLLEQMPYIYQRIMEYGKYAMTLIIKIESCIYLQKRICLGLIFRTLEVVLMNPATIASHFKRKLVDKSDTTRKCCITNGNISVLMAEPPVT